MDNPYSWNTVNPDLFFGRQALLNELLSGLPGIPRCSFGISGGRRMGKSTLLRRIEAELSNSIELWKSDGFLVIPIYIDGLLLPRPLTPSEVWGHILTALEDALSTKFSPEQESLDFHEFREAVQPVLHNVEERVRIIVLFDEVEPILVCDWANSFLAHWRALLSNIPELSEYFSAVFAGAKEIALLQHDIGSPLMDVLEWRSLRCLSLSEARQLMEEPIHHEWPDSVVEKTYVETGGHPMLLQYVMQQVCGGMPGNAGDLTDKAVQKFSSERGWQFNEWWDRYATSIAQRAYVRIPSNGTTVELRALVKEFGQKAANEALEILQHIGIAAAEDDGFAYRRSCEMFCRWHKEYAVLDNAPCHDPRVHIRLSAFDSDLGDKYLSAWKIYQSELPNYSGAVGEMRDTLTLLIHRIAPDEQVTAQPDFSLEPNLTRPSRRQRVRYAARQRYNSEQTKTLVSDFDLLGTECDQLASIVTGTYRSSSGLTHATATREMAFRALKQWDAILAQLLPGDHQE